MPLLPAGTMLHLISIHDNTVTNRRNPDPTVWVGWGQRSIDDMAAAHIGVQYPRGRGLRADGGRAPRAAAGTAECGRGVGAGGPEACCSWC